MPVQHFGALVKDSKKLKRHILIVVLSTLLLAGIAAYFLDQPLSLYFDIPEVRARYWQIARDFTNVGLSEYYFGIAIFSWAFCAFVAPRVHALKPYSKTVDYFRRWGLNFLVALLVSGVLTHLLKFTVGRQRPHKTPDFQAFVFDPLTTHWHWHSFSSGHSQVMFTVATMFSLAFPRALWLWYSIAVYLCATRVIIHDHFLSDIIFGACVGYVGTLLAVKIMQAKTKNGLY